ncbi:MAG: citramalate synthase [Phycisphaeraceae bacterium]|nr:citramalate synthase [Phycisphaeraceae bacterium]
MATAQNPRRVEIYDTTLRDGTQGLGVAFSLVDKIKITQRLDELGVDYIEGGYPLSNPKDVAYFQEAAKLQLAHAKVCAFGMTRRKGVKAQDDPGMKALVESGASVITIVGKTWDLHVDEVLRVSREENLEMIRDSVAFCRSRGVEVFYDAEHLFDGWKANREYALATLRAAVEGGATRLVLCDTNGGSLPAWVSQVVREIQVALPGAGVKLGIHTHNDSGVAVANALAAVEAGAVQVQGTINGIGERCGNVDLTTVVGNLRLKMGLECLRGDSLAKLTKTSRFVYETANMGVVAGQPFVGPGAFAHKGGMHVHAVQRVAHSYEHVDPGAVGNERRVLVSELSGASNIAATLGRKFNIADNKELQRRVLDRVQDLENEGYEFEAAGASFELILHEMINDKPDFWHLDHYRCVITRQNGTEPRTEAIVKVRVNGQVEHQVAEGDGPVNALDGALRKCLRPHYPRIDEVHLRDYKVRVVNPRAETAAKVRVIAQFAVGLHDAAVGGGKGPEVASYFSTVGVNENIVDASWQAITDAFVYHLLETRGVAGRTAVTA